MSVNIYNKNTDTLTSVAGSENGLSLSQRIGNIESKIPNDASATNKLVAESGLLDLIYPLGTIYTSTSSTSPATLFGGTWTQIKDTFLLTAGDTYTAGDTGGSATHTLSVDELPSHTHEVKAHKHGLNSHTHTIPKLTGSTTSTGKHSHYLEYGKWPNTNGVGNETTSYQNGGNVYLRTGNIGWTTNTDGGHSHTVEVNNPATAITGQASGNTANSSAFDSGSAGSGQSFSIMPPYKVVYAWERTA